MWDLLIIVAGCFLTIKLSQASFVLGAIAGLLVIGIIIFRKFTTICTMVAMRNYTTGKKINAFKWFDKGYKHGMTAQQKVTYAYYLLREGKTEKAEQVYNGMLAFGGLKPEERNYIKSNQAILYVKTGRLTEALEILEEIFPNYKNTNIYGTLGYAYILEGNMEKAEKFCLEAYEFNSDNAVILDNVIQVYTKKGDFETALKYAEELWAKEPTFIEGNYDVAVVFAKSGKLDEAKEALNKALSIEPSFLSNVTHEMINELLQTL